MIGMMGPYGWIGLILNFVITIALIVGLVLLIVWLVRRTGTTSMLYQNPGQAPASPKDILQARYARGEITRDQYMQMLADLNQ